MPGSQDVHLERRGECRWFSMSLGSTAQQVGCVWRSRKASQGGAAALHGADVSMKNPVPVPSVNILPKG